MLYFLHLSGCTLLAFPYYCIFISPSLIFSSAFLGGMTHQSISLQVIMKIQTCQSYQWWVTILQGTPLKKRHFFLIFRWDAWNFSNHITNIMLLLIFLFIILYQQNSVASFKKIIGLFVYGLWVHLSSPYIVLLPSVELWFFFLRTLYGSSHW